MTTHSDLPLFDATVDLNAAGGNVVLIIDTRRTGNPNTVRHLLNHLDPRRQQTHVLINRDADGDYDVPADRIHPYQKRTVADVYREVHDRADVASNVVFDDCLWSHDRVAEEGAPWVDFVGDAHVLRTNLLSTMQYPMELAATARANLDLVFFLQPHHNHPTMVRRAFERYLTHRFPDLAAYETFLHTMRRDQSEPDNLGRRLGLVLDVRRNQLMRWID